MLRSRLRQNNTQFPYQSGRFTINLVAKMIRYNIAYDRSSLEPGLRTGLLAVVDGQTRPSFVFDDSEARVRRTALILTGSVLLHGLVVLVLVDIGRASRALVEPPHEIELTMEFTGSDAEQRQPQAAPDSTQAEAPPQVTEPPPLAVAPLILPTLAAPPEPNLPMQSVIQPPELSTSVPEMLVEKPDPPVLLSPPVTIPPIAPELQPVSPAPLPLREPPPSPRPSSRPPRLALTSSKPNPPRPPPVSRPRSSNRQTVGNSTPESQVPAASDASPVGRPAPSPPGVTTPAPQPGPEISAAWKGALSAWLQSHKTYPDEARQRGEEGSALVRFTVDRSGRVLDFTLMRGTGSAYLDAAVGRMLTGAQLPAFPTAMTQDRTTVTVQIRYALQ